MKKLSTRQMIILINIVIITILATVLVALLQTADIIFVYMFVAAAPVAMLTVLILDRYDKEK